MSFIHSDVDDSRDYDPINQSFQNQAAFLKAKLIQTHAKLLKQLELNKEIQDKYYDLKAKHQKQQKENQNMNRRLTQFQNKFFQQEKQKQKQSNILSNQSTQIVQKMKIQFQQSKKQYQKKNQLLRTDLETMRNKILILITEKEKIQEQYNLKNQSKQALSQQILSLQKNYQLKEQELIQKDQLCEIWRRKYQKIQEEKKKCQQEIFQIKNELMNLHNLESQNETIIKQEKQKNSKLLSEIISCQMQTKDLRQKLQAKEETTQKYKDDIFHLQNRLRTQNRQTIEQLQKLTGQYNTLSTILKAKQKQIQELRKKPVGQYIKKKQSYENLKSFVHKLQGEQNSILQSRNENKCKKQQEIKQKQLKSYKQQKMDYMSMISEVGQYQTQLYNFNIQKKKLMEELDRIDDKKVKNKELITRRKQIQAMLIGTQQKCNQIKSQLRKMKIL